MFDASRKYAILGLARSGIAAAYKIRELGGTAFLSDAQPIEKISGADTIASDFDCEFGGHSDRLFQCDTWIVSPGIPLNLPIIAKARAKGIELISEIELGFRVKSSDSKVVAVSGSNGKSTTALLVANWRTLLGGKAGVMGTIGNGLFGELVEAENTTGSAAQVQANLAALQQQGADLVAMEVSSHGLVQHRVAALPFSAAVFTNLSRDHLDYHGTMEAYGAAKEELLKLVDEPCAVINADDRLGRQWLAAYPGAVAFGVHGPIENHAGRQLTAQDPHFHQQGFDTRINSSWGNGVLSAPLLGRFNVSNVLAAMGAMLVLGYDFDALLASAPKLQPVTGRMECFGGGKAPLAVVDYAHTPDALEKALQALRVHCEGRLWCLVGCGGDRDRGKRPMMAAMAEQHADRVILTDDNPRTEEPARIMADMVAGLRDPAAVQVEHDRVKAIELAIGQASKQDIILVAGKGHEDYQIIGTDKRHYSDRETVAAALHTLMESFR